MHKLCWLCLWYAFKIDAMTVSSSPQIDSSSSSFTQRENPLQKKEEESSSSF